MTIALYVIAFSALTVSFFKSREKTLLALKKAWKSFENILPQFLSILIIIGMMLAILTPEQISKLLGSESGWYGVLIAAVIGSITRSSFVKKSTVNRFCAVTKASIQFYFSSVRVFKFAVGVVKIAQGYSNR